MDRSRSASRSRSEASRRVGVRTIELLLISVLAFGACTVGWSRARQMAEPRSGSSHAGERESRGAPLSASDTPLRAEAEQDAAFSAPGGEPQVSPPNILFIMFDDLGYASLGSYGSTVIRTPRLDQLAAEGMRFTQFYSSAPVCSPTRAAVLTGQHPVRFGIRTITNMGGPPTKGIPEEVETLPRLLQGAGYATGHFGKWHLGGKPARQFHPASKGYDRVVVLREKRYLDPLLRRDYGPFVRRKGHLTNLLVDETISFVRAHREQPFFVNLWLLAPHRPLGELPDPPPAGYDLATEEGQYAALVSHADQQIGRLLDTLKDLALDDRTVVVVTSDNGAYRLDGGHRMNGPLRRGKRSVFEGGIRVPMLVRWPGVVPAGSVDESVVTSTDFAPTFAAIAGAQQPKISDGIDFLQVLQGHGPRPPARRLVWEYKDPKLAPTGRAFAVREGNWKLVEEAGRRYLFDLGSDPGEQHDLSRSQPHRVARLASRFGSWSLGAAGIPFAVERTSETVQHDVSTASGAPRFTFAGPGVVALRQHILFDVSLDDFSFGVWVRPRDPRGATGSRAASPQVLAEKRDSWSLGIAANGRLQLTLWEKHSGRVAVVEHPKEVLPGMWQFVAFALFDDLGSRTQVRLYLHAEDGRSGEVVASPVSDVRATRRRILLGNHAEGKRPFRGILESPRFFHRALPTADLEAMAQRCLPNGFDTGKADTQPPSAAPRRRAELCAVPTLP